MKNNVSLKVTGVILKDFTDMQSYRSQHVMGVKPVVLALSPRSCDSPL